ncbi:strawberry notch C-terminal domain-containing protein [Herbaspirillum seropedicae]|uniref:strawberry notch C-terminal domain-containing protein n=1 Tax=Herbaspirillum seropedicae TaxID=964 RepID=UPI00285B9D52|nr:strawberry notch C-terminal domain-containing protein [Herbaspirillum seropedicae]MDR6397897.1 hypothetical protein [Herbaspirillum seropedicae]
MSAPQVMPWLDLSAHGAKLSLFQLPDGSVNLIISGLAPDRQERAGLVALGFEPSKSGKNLIRPGTNVQTAALRKLFPKNVVRQTPVDVVWLREPGKRSEETKDLRETNQLGENYLEQPVYEGETGRFIRLPDGKVMSERDEEGLPPAAFLRAPTDANLALCAEGFLNAMKAGKTMNSRDLRYLGQVIHGEASLLEPSDLRMRKVQEAVEAAMQRSVNQMALTAGLEDGFKYAVLLDGTQPEFGFRTSSSIEQQQYSTPLPMSLALQRIVGDTSGKSLLELTIGNGSLVAALPQATTITGVEIDKARVEQARMLRPGMEIIHGDILAISRKLGFHYDVVIANPPFGGLEQPVQMDGLKCTRLDHQIVLTGLKNRKADGHSVFIIAADRESIIHHGKIAGGSKNFFNWLADHYQLIDVVEMDPALYKKQGAQIPVRMVTVGHRFTAEQSEAAARTKQHRLPDVVPVVHTWAGLWAHAGAVARKLHDQTEAADPEPVEARPAAVHEIESIPAAEVTIPAPAPAAAAAGQDPAATPGEEGDGAKSNDYQAQYVPASRINEPSAMIPMNLLEPVRKALAALENKTGKDVDSFVAEHLQMDPADMAVAFSAEQVDAIALAIARIEEGRGFIEGDQTGQGKGRVLAALGRYAALNNQAVVFLTEKPNLFSDFWRDLKDIGTESLFRPLLVNDGEPIRDMSTNKIEIQACKPGELQRIMDEDKPLNDTGYNILFATYSQFNRDKNKSKKAAWLPSASAGALLVTDESHNAAGDSNTADNIALAVQMSGATIYSSATFAKGAANMRAYAKVFPESVSVEGLAATLVAGGEPLQEILSSMLAEDGVLIRREHDLSKLEFETVVTEATRERDEQWADLLSAALREMSYFSGDVQRIAVRKNKEIKKELDKLPEAIRKGNRMGVAYQGFGSRLYNILRQFSLTIKIDEITSLAVNALEEGRKPVIVLEQTFETLLKEAMSDQFKAAVAGESDEDEGADAGAAADIVDGMVIDQITLRDLLYRVADRLQNVYVRDDYGNGHYANAVSLAETEQEAEAVEEAVASMRARIAELPDIPVSPMDQLRHAIEEAGFSCSEISGRSFMSAPVPGRPGKIAITARPDQRLKTIQEFNNGKLDALILTRAGSTGLSLHASEKFADRRQRQLIEAQIANNVAERIQFWGRVNRRGQVNSPRITCPTSTLPSEIRTLAMQNTKLRKISANTQSNRNNQAELRSVPDILNKIGNDICRRYLVENPDISSLLGIDPEAEVSSEDEAYFANMLTGRIALLPVKQQKDAYEEIGRVYGETLTELESKGQNPFKTSVFDWGARITDQKVFREGSPNGSAFDHPVFISRVEWDQDIEPFSAADVRKLVREGKEALAEKDRRFKLEPIQYGPEKGQNKVDCQGMIDDISLAFKKVQTDSLRSMPQFKDVQEALNATEGNVIKSTQSRHLWLRQYLRFLTPGCVISFSGPEDESLKAMICDLYVPSATKQAHLLGQFSVRLAVPGSDQLLVRSFNQLHTDPLFSYGLTLGNGSSDQYQAFDEAEKGKITYSRVVLTGNMFAAAQFAATSRSGRSAIFTDADGGRHRAVVMPPKMTMDLALSQPMALGKVQIMDIIHRAANEGQATRIVADAQLNDKCCSLVVNPNRPGWVAISVSGAKAIGGVVFNNPALVKLIGDFAGTRSMMTASFPIEKLEPVVTELLQVTAQGFYVDAAKLKQLMAKSGGGEDDVSDVRPAAPARMRA